MYINEKGELVLNPSEVNKVLLALNHSSRYLNSMNCNTLANIMKSLQNEINAMYKGEEKND